MLAKKSGCSCSTLFVVYDIIFTSITSSSVWLLQCHLSCNSNRQNQIEPNQIKQKKKTMLYGTKQSYINDVKDDELGQECYDILILNLEFVLVKYLLTIVSHCAPSTEPPFLRRSKRIYSGRSPHNTQWWSPHDVGARGSVLYQPSPNAGRVREPPSELGSWSCHSCVICWDKGLL